MASFKIAGEGSRSGSLPYTATDEASASIPVPALARKGSAEKEIERGWLPRDIPDDVASKFINGCVLCEILDYRSCKKYGKDHCFQDDFPEVKKACLRMSIETVVEDIASMSDDSWTYNDLLHAEAQVTKALPPMLHLGIDPSSNRNCATGSKQLDLGIIYEQAIPMQKQQEDQNAHLMRLADQNNNQLGTNGIVGRYPVFTPQMPSQSYNQGVQHSIRETDNVETKKEGQTSNISSEKFNQKSLLSLPKPHPPQIEWTNTGSSCKKYVKENDSQKRKLPLGPQIVAGDLCHSLEFQLGVKRRMSSGTPCSKSNVLAGNLLEKNKDSLTPSASVGITTLNPSFNKSLLQENQKPDPMMKHTHCVKVTSQGMTETEVLAVKNGSNTVLNFGRSSVGTPSMPPSSGAAEDQTIIERFSKIDMIAERHGLTKQTKDTNVYSSRKPLSNLHMPSISLVPLVNNEGCEILGEKLGMSKFLIDGSRNTFKTRTMVFLHDSSLFRGQCGPSSFTNPIKLVMSESEMLLAGRVRVEIIYGEEGLSFQTAILPNSCYADLFAAQFTSLMERDGYKLEDDQIQPTKVVDDQIQSTTVVDPDLSDSTSEQSFLGSDSTSVHSFSQEFDEPWYRCVWIQNMSTNQDPPCSCSFSSFPSKGIQKRLHDGDDDFFEGCDDDACG